MTLNSEAKNLNTILISISLGLIGWMGWVGHNNAVSLAEIKGGLVTRQEVEAKIAEVKVKQTSLETDLYGLKLALAERGITEKNK